MPCVRGNVDVPVLVFPIINNNVFIIFYLGYLLNFLYNCIFSFARSHENIFISYLKSI